MKRIKGSSSTASSNEPAVPKKLNLQRLKEKSAQMEAMSKTVQENKKLRAVVDIKMMKEELKQLEDPPLTPLEKQLCSNRLNYSFFDTPCESLAQQLLGKILVRRLENGSILKGKIVETEGYLGVIDKASHSYQNKITPRNIPMYMPPGTIYVYMTYGMYHCFNISSQESDAYVLIRAIEPLVGTEYMELMRNMDYTPYVKEKKIKKSVKHLEISELCNSPYNVCVAFAIEEDDFNQKNICNCEGCAVLIRAVDPIEGIESMVSHRTSKQKSKQSTKSLKEFKIKELCNGPSKLCMAFELHKVHSKYSLCTWKNLWIENNPVNEEFQIVQSSRIGIDGYGPEWASKLLRYYICGNQSVSKRDKKAEALLQIN